MLKMRVMLRMKTILKMRRTMLTLLKMISGARYSGVPHSVHVRPFTRLANPKSVICKRKCMRCAAKRRRGEVYLEVALVV